MGSKPKHAQRVVREIRELQKRQAVIQKGRNKQHNSGNYDILPGDNARFLSNTLEVASLPLIDATDVEQVRQRINEYFSICIKNDMKPTVSGLSLSFGVDRGTFQNWMKGIGGGIKPQEVRDILRFAYTMLTAQMEDYMQNGKINPVAGIFLMKNNMDYKDKTEVVVRPDVGKVESPELLAAESQALLGTAKKVDDEIK